MIGGNMTALVQKALPDTGGTEIGEYIRTWETVGRITGWLDYLGEDTERREFRAKVPESTHVFLADYTLLEKQLREDDCRFVIDGDQYDLLHADDPMHLHRHLEFYLKYTGGREHGSSV